MHKGKGKSSDEWIVLQKCFSYFNMQKMNVHAIDLTLPVPLPVCGLGLLEEAEKLEAKEISETVGCSQCSST